MGLGIPVEWVWGFCGDGLGKVTRWGWVAGTGWYRGVSGMQDDRGNAPIDRGIVGFDTNLMQPRVRMQVPGHN